MCTWIWVHVKEPQVVKLSQSIIVSFGVKTNEPMLFVCVILSWWKRIPCINTSFLADETLAIVDSPYGVIRLCFFFCMYTSSNLL